MRLWSKQYAYETTAYVHKGTQRTQGKQASAKKPPERNMIAQCGVGIFEVGR
jgi:hypothetical protein